MATAAGFPAQQLTDGARCSRCGGFMIIEQCFDLLDGSSGHPDFVARRCVQCGDLIDPIILKNRYPQYVRESSAGKRN